MFPYPRLKSFNFCLFSKGSTWPCWCLHKQRRKCKSSSLNCSSYFFDQVELHLCVFSGCSLLVLVMCFPWLSSVHCHWLNRLRHSWRMVGQLVKTLVSHSVLQCDASWVSHNHSASLFCFLYSESDAVCEPDGPPRLWHRLDCSAALHPAGGAADSGKLGGQKVRPKSRTVSYSNRLFYTCWCHWIVNWFFFLLQWCSVS